MNEYKHKRSTVDAMMIDGNVALAFDHGIVAIHMPEFVSKKYPGLVEHIAQALSDYGKRELDPKPELRS